jgi:hypothetical protein
VGGEEDEVKQMLKRELYRTHNSANYLQQGPLLGVLYTLVIIVVDQYFQN